MAVLDFGHPWVFAFGILGNLVSIFVYLSPLPTFIRICKEKSTLGFQSLPYVVALFSAMLWLYYALLKDAILLISINSLGCLIETIYIFIYLLYASKEPKKQTTKLFAALNVGTFCGIFLVSYFPFHNHPQLRIEVVGWVSVAVSMIVFASPLSIVFQVVRTRSVEFMPFALSFTLTLTAVIWFTYGLLQKDICVAIPNVLGFILGILQMTLYGLYRNPKPIMEEKKAEQGHGVIDIVILHGSDPVHPIDSQPCSSDEDSVKIPEKCPESPETETCSPPAKFHIESPAPVLIVCAV